MVDTILRGKFHPTHSGGIVPGNNWKFAQAYVGEVAVWRYLDKDKVSLVGVKDSAEEFQKLDSKVKEAFSGCSNWSLQKCSLLRVAAERSVVPEGRGAPAPEPTGKGITNLIRYFIISDARPREVVEIDLLRDLNEIYAGDSAFDSIICQENDSTGLWEIFLHEEGKGDVRLSESGSSLQSIFIILSYLRLVPLVQEINWKSLILAVEEPENNLHPALLRRLINFLAAERKKLGFSLVLTTHSPVCIDWAASREDAGIIHVTRNGSKSACRNVMDYDGHTNILDDLDVRGSDILQSNGVIWVEGPSDRVYLRRWLDLISDGELVEGAHYTFMYYGGKILSHFEAMPTSELSTLISMVTLNRNLAVVMDSDRKWKKGSNRMPQMRLNETKMRMRDEVAKRGGMSWVTAGKEIENYVPLQVWLRLFGETFVLKHDFEDIPNMPKVKSSKSTKVVLAHAVVDEFRREDLEGHLDLKQRLDELVGHIRRWNSLDETAPQE